MRFKDLRNFLWVIALFLGVPSYGYVNSNPADSANDKNINWYNKDPETSQVYGIGTNKAYQEILKGKSSQTVIVAVIDSGIDVNHEDLKANIWINEKEIAGNGKDDDGNGYVDDIHGWNFLGNEAGENISFERLEITRNYAKYRGQFEGKTANEIPADQQKTFQKYLKIEKKYKSDYQEAQEELQAIKQ